MLASIRSTNPNEFRCLSSYSVCPAPFLGQQQPYMTRPSPNHTKFDRLLQSKLKDLNGRQLRRMAGCPVNTTLPPSISTFQAQAKFRKKTGPRDDSIYSQRWTIIYIYATTLAVLKQSAESIERITSLTSPAFTFTRNAALAPQF